jgi:hypothetical protein
MTSARIYVLLGGLYGTNVDKITEGGMLALVERLKPFGAVYSTTWGNWNDMPIHDAVPAQKTVVVGYSGGGSRATYLAYYHPELIIDLMVLYDPSPKWQMKPVRANVRSAIVYQNSAPNQPSPFGMLGGGVLVADHTNVKVVPIAEQHMAVEDDTHLHDLTVQAVKDLLAA